MGKGPARFPSASRETNGNTSNTGFVLAARIVERAADEPLDTFLRRRIFAPLGMGSVIEVDSGPLPEQDPVGYTRNALGPVQGAQGSARVAVRRRTWR